MESGIMTINPHDDAIDGPWLPLRGPCFNAVEAPTDMVRQEAVAVLSRCVNPQAAHGRRTGLVIGYVQSGKTSSFISVAALARDNGYQLVLVISGTSLPLYRQSVDRVVSALNLADPNGWIPLHSHEMRSNSLDQPVQTMNSSLRFWRAPGISPSIRKTVLLCVMKNHSHLQNVLRVLQQAELEGVKALIIDDEADQASMNFSPQANGQSSIYSALTSIRTLLPHVTYLQYTATPQAPILIRLDDALSPEFCRVLTAGASFTGPARFFDTDSDRLVRLIPDTDVALAQQGTAPPSFHAALAFYFLGVAAHLLNPDDSGTGNRTMMIHPSQQTIGHEDYRTFTETVRARWTAAFVSTPESAEHSAMRETFRSAFEELSRGIEGISFADLWAQLPNAFALTVVETLNATASGIRSVNWRLPYHILIGGVMLDRGYTVEGLTVTYMPREQARGTADNIQQRARWFGYKERYIGFCRVWLTRPSIVTYAAILEHEESIRNSLRSNTGPLRDWRRQFFLSPNLQPTRRSVVHLHLIRGGFSATWFRQHAPQGSEPSITHRNQQLANRLLAGLEFVPFGRPDWTETQHSEIARGVPLTSVNAFLQSFVAEIEQDAARLVGLAMQTSEYERQNPGAVCDVVRMSSRNGSWTLRTRTATDELHQGRSPGYPRNPIAYPGDGAIRDGEALTLQLFMMSGPTGPIPAIAVYVPAALRRHFAVAEQ